jgi:alpha,alpha-trehalose phosphorylase
MHTVRKYALATRDEDFLRQWGVAMMVETARFWVDLGHFSESKGGAFCINNVTGPDEYSAVVDNNRYTNFMARENLRGAIRGVEFLRDEYPDDLKDVVRETGLDLAELDEWRRAADRMYLAADEKTGIYPQDDSFLDKEPWDFARGPAEEERPLLLHHHPLTIYRHRVIKQADVVMAIFLLGQDFTPEERRRNFDYYDPLTTRDSSLSSCIQSIVASEIGYPDKAMEYFMEAVLVDMADLGGNVSDGVHIASAGGVWMALVHGFGGMRDYGGALSFEPRLPAGWEKLRFRLAFLGRRLEIEIAPGEARYRLIDGEALRFVHQGEPIELTPAEPVAALPCAAAPKT